MTAPDPSEVVRDGYDRLDGTFRTWVAQMLDGPRAPFLVKVLRLIPPGSDVLEIGCGPGTDAPALAEGRRYTGIDLSSVQLAHARAAVPGGTFPLGDVLEVDLSPESFDAAVAFYVFGHIPAARTGELLGKVRSWLRPGGWLCASFGTSDNPGAIEPSWLGVADMYFSSLPPGRTDAALRSNGFEIHSAETITEIEVGEGPATFRWVIARRAGERR
ncbi:MAG TPA: class I SAM-dependent methyltransferase [Actinomycetota bacterium]